MDFGRRTATSISALQAYRLPTHLELPQEHGALAHLRHTVTEPRYLLSFVSVLFLATGGFRVKSSNADIVSAITSSLEA